MIFFENLTEHIIVSKVDKVKKYITRCEKDLSVRVWETRCNNISSFGAVWNLLSSAKTYFRPRSENLLPLLYYRYYTPR